MSYAAEHTSTLIDRMIVGIGVDLVNIPRVSRVWHKYGDRFLCKFLAPAEIACAHAGGASYVAGRFAAKEAAVKALGTGFARGICGFDIETFNMDAGAPGLRFLGNAALRAQELGARHAFISISHEKDMAVAMVILES